MPSYRPPPPVGLPVPLPDRPALYTARDSLGAIQSRTLLDVRLAVFQHYLRPRLDCDAKDAEQMVAKYPRNRHKSLRLTERILKLLEEQGLAAEKASLEFVMTGRQANAKLLGFARLRRTDGLIIIRCNILFPICLFLFLYRFFYFYRFTHFCLSIIFRIIETCNIRHDRRGMLIDVRVCVCLSRSCVTRTC